MIDITTLNKNTYLLNLVFASNGTNLYIQCSVESAIRELTHIVSELVDGAVSPTKLFFDSESTLLLVSRNSNNISIKEHGIMGKVISMDIETFYEHAMKALGNLIQICQDKKLFRNKFIFEEQKSLFIHLTKDIASAN